jgi:predicted HTH transcriptional regulator
MTKKETFIEIVQTVIFDSGKTFNFSDKELNDALEFFEEFKNNKTKNSKNMTENGKKLLSWMQENVDTMANLFTSKEAAEALFTSGRSIAGSMRKLVNDGYVEKTGKDPVQYSLTEAGKNYQFDN